MLGVESQVAKITCPYLRDKQQKFATAEKNSYKVSVKRQKPY